MSKVEAIILHVLSALKTEITDYCSIETIDGEFSTPTKQVLIYKDGTCASIIRFNGITSVLGREHFFEIVNQITRTLHPFFSQRGHMIQVVFRKDLDATDSLEKLGKIQKETAKKLELEIDDLIDESIDKYKQYVYEEDCYFVLWSKPVLLDKVEVKIDRDNKNKLRKELNWPSFKNGQNLLRPISYLYDRHIAFVEKFFDDLSHNRFSCSLEKLNVADALHAIKRSAYRDSTSPDWKPVIPGHGIAIQWKTNDDFDDASEWLYPPISSQILSTTAEIGDRKNPILPDSEFVRVGSRVYAPVVINVPPRTNSESFNSLFSALNRMDTRENGQIKALPYSISFMIEGDGLSFGLMNTIFANVLGFSSEQNRNINLAYKDLKEYKRDNGCVVKLKIAAMTWSQIDPNSIKELSLRKTKLIRALEGWGGAQTKELTGNALIAWQTNTIALDTKHCGNPAAAPLSAAIQLLPISRPASAYSNGTIIQRSLDGAILPLERFSSEQTTWITLVSGKPGSGKSVLMNNLNTEACLGAGITRLPYIMILDIGISSMGFIELIKDALPADKKYLATYRRLQNNKKDAINVLDTSLGQRQPLERDFDFMRTFITGLVTPAEADKPADGMGAFVGRVLKVTFEYFEEGKENSSAKTYSPNHNSLIDEGLKKLIEENRMGECEIHPDTTTYWELVDLFFDNKMYYHAEVAQRYAVPTLTDLIAVAQSEVIKNEYKGKYGENMIDLFCRGIREAVTDYPIFSFETQFELGSARIVSIDLQDVAAKNINPSSVKKTNLMYMMARQSFMKKIAYSSEDLSSISPKYVSYFEKIVNELIDDEKVLMMDEFHKTQINGKESPLQQQVLTDGREARKWKLEIILGSQLMQDFGTLTNIATSIYILDSGTTNERAWLKENIGLSDTAEDALVNHVHGPNAHGATYLAIIQTKKGKSTQLYTSTLGAMRLWSLSTTAEDRKMRNIFYSRIPNHVEARKLLAKHFPSGGCKSIVDREKNSLFKGDEFVDDEKTGSVIEKIADKILSITND